MSEDHRGVIAQVIEHDHWPFDDYFGECPCGWSHRTGSGYITDHLAQVAIDALGAAGYGIHSEREWVE